MKTKPNQNQNQDPNHNRLYITVPNLFKCPISLDVMKSPVSLCTGVTYDRSSIQHWLDSGHNTCPATMQVLSTKDFIPNLTLLRLINLWNQSSSSTTPRPDAARIRAWVDDVRHRNTDSLAKIVEFLTVSDENKRRFIAEFDSFIDSIIILLSKEDVDGVDIKFLELTVRAFELMLLQNGIKERLQKLTNQKCLSTFLYIIINGNSTSKISSIRVLEALSIGVNEYRPFIQVLIQLLNNSNNQALNESILSLFISFNVARSMKSQLVQLGLVNTLTNILSTRNATVLVVGKSLKLLSLVSMCADGRLAISEDEKCAECIVKQLMKVSKPATEDGVTVLWSLCCLFNDERVKEKVVKSNGLTKVLLVMQSEGEGNVRKMCRELVKVLRVKDNSGGVIISYETKTTHIMPC